MGRCARRLRLRRRRRHRAAPLPVNRASTIPAYPAPTATTSPSAAGRRAFNPPTGCEKVAAARPPSPTTGPVHRLPTGSATANPPESAPPTRIDPSADTIVSMPPPASLSSIISAVPSPPKVGSASPPAATAIGGATTIVLTATRDAATTHEIARRRETDRLRPAPRMLRFLLLNAEPAPSYSGQCNPRVQDIGAASGSESAPWRSSLPTPGRSMGRRPERPLAADYWNVQRRCTVHVKANGTGALRRRERGCPLPYGRRLSLVGGDGIP